MHSSCLARWTFRSRLDLDYHLLRLDQALGIFTVRFRLELNFVNRLSSLLSFVFNMAGMDFASAATSAQMNPAEVIQHLMAGTSMETGYEQRDVKLKVNVIEQSDTRAWAMLREHDENIEVEFVLRKDTTNTEDWVEICLQHEAPLFNPLATSSAPTSLAVEGTENYTSGLTGVDLYQVGSYGSALSCLRSTFTPKLKDVKAFEGAGHVNRTRPPDCPDGPLAMEASLHIEAWRTKYPKIGWQYALEFEVQYACVKGVCPNISELLGHRWNTNSNWREFVQQTGLLSLHDKRATLTETFDAMALDADALPAKADARHTHRMP